MSGIVGILNLDRAPVDRDLLQRMTDSLAYRGPDRTGIWFDGPIGFGHTLLATTFEHQREKQPCSFDEKVWIVADARVDDRDRLKRELTAKGRHEVETATDVELILHAYHVWTEDCVQHLLGDFAFAVWDWHQQKLFCARDHFGIKLLYFAHLAHQFIFSNELKTVRMHPLVTEQLNELAIADFLVFDVNQSPATTAFHDIGRLPPAHSVKVETGKLRQTRYWSLRADTLLALKRPQQYVERFLELLNLSVHDRLRTDRAAVFMSGGIDSTSIAASARRVLALHSPSPDLRAYTGVYDNLMTDTERFFAGLAAETIGIPVHFYPLDEIPLFETIHSNGFPAPEPFNFLMIDNSYLPLKDIAAHGRMVLYGEDADTLLAPVSVVDMLRSVGLPTTLTQVTSYFRQYRKRPPIGIGIYSRLQNLKSPGTKQRYWQYYPTWLNSEFERRLDIKNRWRMITQTRSVPQGTIRRVACRRLTSTHWQHIMEGLDTSVTSVPVEFRLPFFDIRLTDFMLAIPPFPWCINKTLLREAARHILPESLRLRPKTPLAVDPVHARIQHSGAADVGRFEPMLPILDFIIPDAVPPITGNSRNSFETWMNLRPWRLNAWLQTLN